jgi:hypothetical protein
MRALNFGLYGRARPGKTAFRTAVPASLLTRKRSQVQTLSRPPHIIPAQARSEDLASWFSRLTLGRRAASGQQLRTNRRADWATDAANAGLLGGGRLPRWQRAAGLRQPRVGRLELRPASHRPACSRPHPVVDLRFLQPVVTAGARCAPLAADRVCTQRVPRAPGRVLWWCPRPSPSFLASRSWGLEVVTL